MIVVSHVGAWMRLPTLLMIQPKSGRFLLTGSAVPVGHPVHSGAGRIVARRMRPLSLAERDLVVPTVSLRQMLEAHCTDL
jgi:hypothetical protein